MWQQLGLLLPLVEVLLKKAKAQTAADTFAVIFTNKTLKILNRGLYYKNILMIIIDVH